MLTHIHHVLEHLQLRTVLEGLLDIHLRSNLDGTQIGGLFISQHHLLADREPTELAEQHLGKNESVVYLDDCHLGFVHLHADAQTLGTGSHPFLDHFLNITIQLLHQVQIALSQLLLMAQ